MSKSKERTRNIKMHSWVPGVSCNEFRQTITLRSVGTQGATTYVSINELSVGAAANLVRELRARLRAIRNYQVERLDRAIDNAEGPL